MDHLIALLDFVLHLNQHLGALVDRHGPLVYALLFVIVFSETGLVVAAFLPGDSLLFAAGAIAATGALDVWQLIACLTIAAVLGDTTNYWIGSRGGTTLARRFPRWVRPEHLERTRNFYERYGGKTIVIARFVPIVRTFAPFVAGVGRMGYFRFSTYNVLGAILWVFTLVPAGYFFAATPVVQQHFGMVILAIIALSVSPAVVEIARERRRLRAQPLP